LVDIHVFQKSKLLDYFEKFEQPIQKQYIYLVFFFFLKKENNNNKNIIIIEKQKQKNNNDNNNRWKKKKHFSTIKSRNCMENYSLWN